MKELALLAFIYLKSNAIEIIGILIGTFIAYHIFFLAKRLYNQARLTHKDAVKENPYDLLAKIVRDGIRRKTYLVNINRYFKDYPSNQEKLGSGYSHIKGEIKTTRYDGIEFFCEMPRQAYITENGEVTLKETDREAFLVYPVGLVPYEWIEYVDLEGDEYEGVPLFYCKFRGKIYWKSLCRRLIPFGYPYKYLTYYKKSDVYHEGSDPADMEWSYVEITE